MSGIKIALIGATGAVGSVFLQLIEERNFPASSVRLCASERSWGKKLGVLGQEVVVEQATSELFDNIDIAFFAASADVSRSLVPVAINMGALVIDKSSAFRMETEVPLVVPEVNGADLNGHSRIIAVPNCSTTPLVMALKPLNDANPIRRVIVATYQSVSGTGATAIDELRTQSKQVLSKEAVHPKQYPHQIAFNILPHVDSFEVDGHTTEEVKIVNETRKILHLPELALSATCARVPVAVGHSEAVHVEFDRPTSPALVSELLSTSPGLQLVDDPASNVYPTPIAAEGTNEVLVGRIRADQSDNKSVAMWLAIDNLRKGAALNAIHIAEEVLNRGLLQPSSGRNKSTS